MKKKLQVFISSTFTDLIVERQAAVSAILKAGHIPAGMELFTAGDQSQLSTIKAWIDESDVYMLILGGRYGSVESTSGLSYTELEYNYAVEQQKPLFAVVITEEGLTQKVKAYGPDMIERKHGTALEQFRKLALSNMSSFFMDEKDIKLAVYESLGTFATNRNLKGWVSADTVSDPKPLLDEIKKLSDENSDLKRTIAALERRGKQQSQEQKSYDEIKELLTATKVEVPEALLPQGIDLSSEFDLFSTFYGYKEQLIAGITNESGISPVTKFLYFNVCPKLQIYGLIANEKVPGVSYRRSYVTAQGNAFLAGVEKELIKGTLIRNDRVATPSAKPKAETAAIGDIPAE